MRRGPVLVTKPRELEFRPTPESSAFFQYVQVLVAAVELGGFHEIQWLLENGPDSSATEIKEAQFAALFAAVACGQHAVCDGLLQMLDPAQIPMCTAVKKVTSDVYSSKRLEEATSFLALAYEKTLGTLNNSADFYAEHAQHCQYLGMVQVLLKRGVKPLSGAGCLLEATAHNLDVLAIQMLLQHGLPVNATSDGSTLLHLIGSNEPERQAGGGAARELQRKSVQAEPLVRLLLAAGANPVTRNNKKETAIDVCLKGGHLQAIMQDALVPRS